MHVCVYVYMYVCMYVCIYVRTYVCIYTSMTIRLFSPSHPSIHPHHASPLPLSCIHPSTSSVSSSPLIHQSTHTMRLFSRHPLIIPASSCKKSNFRISGACGEGTKGKENSLLTSSKGRGKKKKKRKQQQPTAPRSVGRCLTSIRTPAQ